MDKTRSQGPTRPPLWHWGFIYDLPFIFKLAQKLQAEGSSGSRRAPLPDIDFTVDPPNGEDRQDDEDDEMEDETYRIMTMLIWGGLYLEDYVGMDHLANYTVFVHNGGSGKDERVVHCVAFAHAKAWHFWELNGLERTKGELPDDDTLEKFTELLGPPGWYLSSREVDRDDIGPRLESGEYQMEQGMPVVFTQEA